MKNILIFQPYLSTRALSSGTLERQFRFLSLGKQHKVYALLDISEKDYGETLENSWVTPVYANLGNYESMINAVKQIQNDFNFEELYIARTYCTPVKQEDIDALKCFEGEATKDFRYLRNYVPIEFSSYGLQVKHMVYDPLELMYDELIPKEQYQKYSSMNNVDNALPHMFADFGYYDKDKEVSLEEKELNFVFGGTAPDEKREKWLKDLYDLNAFDKNKVFIRTKSIDNLVPNAEYEMLASKALFTYVLPSYNPKCMSFTRMLLALSQGTIPLLHPENNLDCLFGYGFEMRDTLKLFFKSLIISIEDLKEMLSRDRKLLLSIYKSRLSFWHNTTYHQWLKDRV